MAQATTTATLDGFFKTIYGDKHIDAVPENLYLVKNIDFREAEKIGRKFSVPVMLSREHGATYLASGDGVTTLNDSVAAVSKNIEVDGSQIILRGQIDYEAAAKAQTSKAAFMNTTELLVQNLLESASNRLEIMFMYGGTGLGTVSSLASQTITFTAASWAVGIWAGMEGALIDVYQSNGTVRQANLTIASVDVDNKAITVTGTVTGIASTDVVYFKGAKGKECLGLDSLLSNTGTQFGIDASAYSLWKPNTYAVGGALTMTKILSATAKAVGRGLREDVVVLVSPTTWQNLNADQAALRHYDQSYSPSKAEGGFEAITYHGQNGKIEVMSHAMVKEGEGFIFPKKRLKRVGAQDLSFKTPGRQDEIFLHLSDKNAYELRIYGNQALFCEAPAKCVKLTGIVNS